MVTVEHFDVHARIGHTTGELSEYIIPKWIENGSITIRRVSGVNPEF